MSLMAFVFFLVLSLVSLFVPTTVHAVCPVCTVAVAAGLGLSRWLGIDDTVSGVWFGALTISAAVWLANWLRAKHYKIPYLYPLSIVSMFLITVVPLKFAGFIGHPFNQLWGIDKLILGMTVGVVVFLIGMLIDQLLRIIHTGKVYLPYQRVIVPVVLLILSSLWFFFITQH